MSKKVTFSLFHRKFENGPFLAKNGPKSAFLAQNAQKWGFLAFFSKTAHWNFLIFCRKPNLCSPKNITAFVFGEIWKNFWSLDGVDGPLDSPPFIRPFVRTCPFSRKSAQFSDFLYWKMKKMSKKVTFSLFHRKFENGPFLAKNGPKSAFLAPNTQKWGFLAFFSKTAHCNFLIFSRSLVSGVKILLWFFGEIWKIDPNLA